MFDFVYLFLKNKQMKANILRDIDEYLLSNPLFCQNVGLKWPFSPY